MNRRDFITSIAAGIVGGVVCTDLPAFASSRKKLLFIEVQEPLSQSKAETLMRCFANLTNWFDVVMLNQTCARVEGEPSTFFSVDVGCKGKVFESDGTEMKSVQWVDTKSGLVGVLNRDTRRTDIYLKPGVSFIPA